jgi:rhodanese-related sulfurtransferase
MLDTSEMRCPSSPLAQTGMLLVLATICALVSNSVATPSRHLAWQEQPSAARTVPPAKVLSAPLPAAPVQPPTKPTPVARPAATTPPANPARFAADPAQPIREITPEDAWALFRAKTPFLDARRSTEYAQGHIAGAWNASVWESTVEAQVTEFEAAVKPGTTSPLVLYCDGGDCEDSHLLASRLTPLGYRNLLIYRAGYPDWVNHGRPTEKGVRP